MEQIIYSSEGLQIELLEPTFENCCVKMHQTIFIHENTDKITTICQRLKVPCHRSSYDDDVKRPITCSAIMLAVSLGLTLIIVIAIEIMNATHYDNGFWIHRYNITRPSWCEATYANHDRFIMEPANARSAYSFVAVGCWMMVLAMFDRFYLWKATSKVMDPSERDSVSDACENGESDSKELSESEVVIKINNGIISYPHITFIHGIFNVLLGLGSFWWHACECGPGGTMDVAGMLAVVSFPIWYTPLQLVIGAKENNSPTGGQDCHYKYISAYLSILPPIGQFMVWILSLYSIINSINLFLCLSQVPLFCAVLYIYCWKNKRPQQPGYQKHSLNLWLILLSLMLFSLAFLVWTLDNNGTWCTEGSPFQGHAMWHILGAGALVCIYLLYRHENITVGEI